MKDRTECPDCTGEGKVRVRRKTLPEQPPVTITVTCLRCKGRGWIDVRLVQNREA